MAGSGHDGAGDSDGEHPKIHHVGMVALIPNDANGAVYPDENKCCCKRNANGESVRRIVSLPLC